MQSVKENFLHEVSEMFDDLTVEIARLRAAVRDDRISKEDLLKELDELEAMLT